MLPDFVIAAKAEAESLERRLSAVRALIAAYDEAAVTAPQAQAKMPKTVGALTSRQKTEKSSAWGERPKDQYSPYGQSIVDAALAVVHSASELPIKTREIATKMQSDGVEIRGNDPVNALGALLARSSALESKGKQGWMPVNGYGIISPNENGAAEATPDAEEAPTSSFESRSDFQSLLG